MTRWFFRVLAICTLIACMLPLIAALHLVLELLGDPGQLFAEAGTVRSTPTPDHEKWTASDLHGAGVTRSEVLLKVEEKKANASFELRLSKEHPQRAKILERLHEPLPFVVAAWGVLEIDGVPLVDEAFFQPSITLDSNTEELVVALRAIVGVSPWVNIELGDRYAESRAASEGPAEPLPKVDRITIEFPGRILKSAAPEPSTLEKERVEFEALADGTPLAWIDVSVAAENPVWVSDHGTLRSVLGRLDGWIRGSPIWPLFAGLGVMIALAWSLKIAPAEPNLSPAIVGIQTLTAFHGTLYAAELLRASISSIPDAWYQSSWSPFAHWLGEFFSMTSYTVSQGWSSVFAICAVAAILPRAWDRADSAWVTRAMRIAFRVTVAALSAIAASAFVTSTPKAGQLLALFVAVSLLLVALVVVAISRLLTLAAPPSASAFAFLLIALMALDASGLYWEHGRTGSFAIFGVVAASALVIVLQLASDARRLPGLSSIDRPWVWAALVLLTLCMALPLPLFLPARPGAPSTFGIWSLFEWLLTFDGLILVIWIGFLAPIVAAKSQGSLLVPPAIQQLVILAAATQLFEPRAIWFGLPLQFLLGWYLLQRWLLRRGVGLETLALQFDAIRARREQLIDALIDLTAAESALRTFRRSQRTRLASGELSLGDYRASVANKRSDLIALRTTAPSAQSPRDLAFAFGPHDNSWDNGLHGLKWSLVISIPWIGLGLSKALSAHTGSDFPLLQFLSDLAALVTTWAAFGWVLGFFFPYIRGRAGLQKSLVLFLVVAAPLLTISLLDNESGSDWGASIYVVLPIFLHCMLLGLLAFDYENLRRAGSHDWRLLLDVHGLGFLSLSLSSVVAATATAIATVAAGQAGDFITALLRVMWPSLGVAPTQ